MARNLQGFFSAMPDCTHYSVKIIADPSLNTFEEIYLAGDNPFVVTYDTSKTPFDPIRYSRASINVVADEKFLDVFSEQAQGTQVILTNEDNNSVEWVGYLTSNLLSVPDISCGAETFALEAQDCLSTLEYYDYKLEGSAKTIVTFGQIFAQILRKCNLYRYAYMDASLKRVTGSTTQYGDRIPLLQLSISEQNFFSSDTDEPWNLREVLEEMCKYLGYTAIQYKNRLYLHDNQYWADATWQGDRTSLGGHNYFVWRREDVTSGPVWYFSYIQAANASYVSGVTLSQDLIRGTGADISLETLYNKIQVKDSFYEIDHFVPDLYEDVYLNNRLGDFWKCNNITRTGKFKYINKGGWIKKEDKDESEHVYYIRKFDHEYYEPVYLNKSDLSPAYTGIPEEYRVIKTTNVIQSQVDRHEYADGTYDISATFTNNDPNNAHTVYLRANLQYTWWNGTGNTQEYSHDEDEANITIPAGESRDISLHCYAQYAANFTCDCDYNCYYYTEYSTTANWLSLSESQDTTTELIGGTIVDLATFDKPMDTAKYNYETEANISFERYLMIHQADMPVGIMHPYWNFLFFIPLDPLKDSEIETYFPCIFKLKNNYSNPMIINDNAYLSLDASAIYERYDVEYINPDWATENTGDADGIGLFNRTRNITTTVPALIFKLKIGNKYWSSQSGWTTTDSCFVVDLGTDKTDKDDTDFTAWWNKEHPVLNNVEWTDWAGAKGYKIPLDSSLDFTQPIVFQVHLPSRIQAVQNKGPHDGMNNYCWVKDLKIELTTKDRENYDLSDILYENIINSGSVNTLSDVTCKFTTYPGNGQHSYSSVALDGVLMDNVIKLGLDGNPNKCEENIIKAYTNQYAFNTIKQTMTIDSSISPYTKIKDPTLGKYFAILGGEIDYAMGRQKVTMIEMRPWSVD